MHIFGGVIIPEERITNEHWALHLPTLTWSPLTLNTHDDDDDNYVITEPDNSTDIDLNAVDVSMEIINANSASGPIRARGHTAHVIGSTMVVLFGMTDSQHTFIYYVQEYDFGKCNAVLSRVCCGNAVLSRVCCGNAVLSRVCCGNAVLSRVCCGNAVLSRVVAVFEVCCVLFQSRVSGQSPVRTDWSQKADWDTRQCMMSRLDWCMCMVAISLGKCPRSCWSMTQWLTSGRDGAGGSTSHTLTFTFTPPPSLSPSLTLSLPHSPLPSLPPSLSPPLPSLPPSLSPSLTPPFPLSLPHSLPPFPLSLPHSLPPSLPPSLSPSLTLSPLHSLPPSPSHPPFSLLVDQLQSTSIPPSSSGTVSCLCLVALGLNKNASQTSC